MRRSTLASKLVSAATAGERHSLLRANASLADDLLAAELLEICYTRWMSKPALTRRSAAAAVLLADVNPTDHIKATANWIDGIAKITLGRFDAALSLLDAADNGFCKISADVESAKTRVAKLIAYGMIGRYDKAAAEGASALKVFVKSGDQLSAGKIELNLSNIVSRQGLHREAKRLCRSACGRFESAGASELQAMAENGLANSAMELNELDAAEAYYKAALSTAKAAKMDVTVAEIEASMGNLAAFRNRYADALRRLESSRDRYDLIGMPHQSAIAELEVADLYTELNLVNEAADAYKRVVKVFRGKRLRGEEARALLGLAKTSLWTGDIASARRSLARGRKLFESERNPAGQVVALLGLVRFALDAGRITDAERELRNAEKLLTADLVRQRTEMELLRAEADLRRGNIADSKRALTDLMSKAVRSGDNETARQASIFLGEIALAAGDKRRAKAHFKRAVEHTEGIFETVGAEQLRIAFSEDKFRPYLLLAANFIDQNELTSAFEVIEMSRARALNESMGGRAKAKKRDERIDAAANELNWLYKRLESAAAADRDDILAKISNREKDLAAHRLRLTGRAAGPRKAVKRVVGNGLAKRVSQVAGRQHTIIEFFEIEGEISAFVIDGNGISVSRGLCTADEISHLLDELRLQFGTMRYGAALPAAFRAESKRRSETVLARLFDALVGPLLSRVRSASIVFIPCGVLNYVPFPALFHDGDYLITNYEITVSPSAAVWITVSGRRRRKANSGLLIGIDDATIPQVKNEIANVKRSLMPARILFGKSATTAAFVELASQYDVLHLACHGEFRSDNPAFSYLKLADGRLTMHDISGLDLRARLVTLSACETGISDIRNGDEIIGLSRGFLTAGASAMIVSLWNANDASTAKLMSLFYRYLQRNGSPATSLRQAQSKMSKMNDGDGHPYFWAGFVLVGK